MRGLAAVLSLSMLLLELRAAQGIQQIQHIQHLQHSQHSQHSQRTQQVQQMGLAKPTEVMHQVMYGCPDWNAYFLPQAHFWAGEVWRRQQKVELDDKEGIKALRKFAHQSVFLTCIPDLDARKGSEYWSNRSLSYFLQVARSDSLLLPPLSSVFEKSSALLADPSCIVWAEYMQCDLGSWAKELKGSKDYGDGVCWDKVEHPSYTFTTIGPQLFQPHHARGDVDQKYHPEYLECLDHNIDAEVIDAICPLGGYKDDGVDGVPYYGDGVRPSMREEVDKCREKLPSEGAFDKAGFLKVTPQMAGLW